MLLPVLYHLSFAGFTVVRNCPLRNARIGQRHAGRRVRPSGTMLRCLPPEIFASRPNALEGERGKEGGRIEVSGLIRRTQTKLWRDERGFTLHELLVVMMIMLIVMFSLYSIFDMGIRVFGFGNDKVEAVENTRIGLDKMSREMRAAYPADRVNNNTNLFWSPGTPGSANMPPAAGPITFGNDLNGNRRIDSGEQITYSLSGTTLQRNGEAVTENVKSGGLIFSYRNANLTPVTSEADIRVVRIKLEVSVNRNVSRGPVTQILQTDVTLRNRGI